MQRQEEAGRCDDGSMGPGEVHGMGCHGPDTLAPSHVQATAASAVAAASSSVALKSAKYADLATPSSSSPARHLVRGASMLDTSSPSSGGALRRSPGAAASQPS